MSDTSAVTHALCDEIEEFKAQLECSNNAVETLKAELEETRQDLSDARNGWESATELAREYGAVIAAKDAELERVRSFAELVAHSGSEPLNSIALYRGREDRRIKMAELREMARESLASPSATESVVQVDEIVTQLYRRFRDWSKRGFGPDDVTWCEVKADVVALLQIQPALASPAAELVPQHKIDGLLHQVEIQERQINELRAKLDLVRRHNGQDFWYWQNDGDDHAESMASDLPVVIRADQLRALIAQPAPVAQSDRDYNGTLEAIARVVGPMVAQPETEDAK